MLKKHDHLKKAGYIALFFVLLIQTAGSLLILNIQQSVARNEMDQLIKSSKAVFQKITLSLSEYQKSAINAHEIYVNGRLYDVKSLKADGEEIALLVINDTKEESIIENVREMVNATNRHHKEFPSQCIKLLSLLYISPNAEPGILISQIRQNIYPSPTEKLLSPEKGIPFPPPKFA